jgi:hypothetical protein
MEACVVHTTVLIRGTLYSKNWKGTDIFYALEVFLTEKKFQTENCEKAHFRAKLWTVKKL